ncbi:hypothetical protein [Cyclobacterium xiamenense]|uniref:hypothetical protein n=1 Tax=Cyclobacterium xiamenense TaxID=1297121 RepID=UPI0012B6D5B3|nr:hypothetical protein [Cyclobacterium xiamenense]
MIERLRLKEAGRPAQNGACPDGSQEGAEGLRGEGFFCLDFFGTFWVKPVLSSVVNQGQKVQKEKAITTTINLRPAIKA